MSATAPGLRGPGSSPAQERRAGWERKRCGGAEELLQTEGKYLEQLEGVATYFVAILKAKGILKPEVHEALFGSWESICSASRTLLFHLARGHFALGLEGFCHQLVFYVRHAENLEQAQNTLEKLVRKNQAFSRFKKLQESRPELKGRCLEELLPLPLQRLHQYRHLLQDLVKHTPPESSGFDRLQGALKSVLEVLHRVQEIACVRENLEMMRQVQKRLKGQKTRVLAPDRLSIWAPCCWTNTWAPIHALLSQGCQSLVPAPQLRHYLGIQRTASFASNKEPPWQHSQLHQRSSYLNCHARRDPVGRPELSFPQKKLLLMSCDQEDFDKWHQSLVGAARKLQVSASPASQKVE